ncbi:pyridoxal-phosphate-dependent aminotransferase family protein [Goodfellowiella coeruleoviolacea]|uniref:Alanine-glyoxylate aminotransferase apoenzyme n=1 Tax=Goodfellowiella coeruleoviolacea TaxID=334858 RepID=A0AAE3GEB8_9PSEU|nr:alanine--glyoxylate aminotransferase family protein [Goodfellowiella coeruleoviolacea]MCP2166651.1 alanine-glyoxylate aminotransferase apoenzyme (EC 2.6.1.44) [Goodfellowiella coeruleoviolacea]
MAMADRILLGPGPSNPYPEATSALAAPLLGHLDPEFLRILDQTCERLRQVWGTANRRTLPLSGTGSIGMEAAFANLVRPGQPVVVAVNGLFGERMCDVAARYGATVHRVDHEWGQPVDVDRVLAAHPAPALVGAVHAETSTGVRSDIAALGAALRARDEDTLLLADCVTSLGGIEVAVDDWGVDVAYSGTQKCLGVAPGLAPFTISERAWAHRVEHPPTWYLDLGMIGDYVSGTASGGRTYHHTAPVAMIASLHAALGRVLDEGLDAVVRRHHAAGQRLQDGLVDLGLELFAADGHRLPELTTVRVPDGVDSAQVRGRLLTEYGIEIGAGAGKYASTVWRIGLMGHNARLDRAELVLAALRQVLRR